ncbi:tetratricopeptide (TPR) repeat protein [Nonomuraea thailandensis]|uniref:Tetratricopeptide (TPR) repeat protein n=1 Tax=Nonomuraea thailandensis TaxID=1188745 RepID=A0A9X2K965_9ACTN|nr:ATP-binding protein [Nonomuraea thailandensis]MCP2365422.1 tetratricopeptide (TPR) repeat protein [Nonomuraea thailandensis]
MTIPLMTNGVYQGPYVGQRPFREDEDSRFFGRRQESSTIADAWRKQRLLILHGPSGVGRTSLLRAGVLPLIELGATGVLPVGRVTRRRVFPSAALPEHNPYVLGLLASWSPADSVGRLAGLTLTEFLKRQGDRASMFSEPVPLLAAVDQIEELLDGPPGSQSHRDEFLTQLNEAVAKLPELRLLIVARDTDLPWLRDRLQLSPALIRMEPLDHAAAVEAVSRPLHHTGRWFAGDTAAEIAADLRGATQVIEPALLQVVCSRLWEALPAEVEAITMADVGERAGVDRSLAAFCGEVVEYVTDGRGVSAPSLMTWLQQHFTRSAAEPVAEGESETRGMPNGLLRALEDRHLLKAELQRDGRVYRLQHERLAGPLLQARPAGRAALDTDSREHLEAAAVALAKGLWPEAERELRLAVQFGEEEDLRLQAEVECLWGDIAHARKDHERAGKHYREAAMLFEALQDTFAVAWLLAAAGAVLLRDEERGAEVMAVMRSAADRLPDDLSLQVQLGRTLWLLGRDDAAKAILGGVLAADAAMPQALRARGEMLADLGDVRAALADLHRVRGYRPPTTRAAHALVLSALSREGEGENDLLSALGDAPEHGLVLLYAARARAAQGDHAEAAALARRALTADPPLLPAQREKALQLSRSVSGGFQS